MDDNEKCVAKKGNYETKSPNWPNMLVKNMVTGQLTPNHLTPESSHTIFGQLTLYMK